LFEVVLVFLGIAGSGFVFFVCVPWVCFEFSRDLISFGSGFIRVAWLINYLFVLLHKDALKQAAAV
jgi:hypothetical protein